MKVGERAKFTIQAHKVWLRDCRVDNGLALSAVASLL